MDGQGREVREGAGSPVRRWLILYGTMGTKQPDWFAQKRGDSQDSKPSVLRPGKSQANWDKLVTPDVEGDGPLGDLGWLCMDTVRSGRVEETCDWALDTEPYPTGLGVREALKRGTWMLDAPSTGLSGWGEGWRWAIGWGC